MSVPSDDAEVRRLRWRCRRGMRELDQLMLRYLDRCWPQDGADQRGAFERLLAVEDDQLWRWFMGREAIEDPALRALVERIQQLPA